MGVHGRIEGLLRAVWSYWGRGGGLGRFGGFLGPFGAIEGVMGGIWGHLRAIWSYGGGHEESMGWSGGS